MSGGEDECGTVEEGGQDVGSICRVASGEKACVSVWEKGG